MPFPVDMQYVLATEERLSTTFPSMFRGKMMRDNGGSVEAAGEVWFLYPFFDQSDKKRIARTCNDIVRETMRMREWLTFPRDAVAIGNNGTGDQLIFLPSDTSPKELGPAVYWWNHETGELERVADDFAELL